nr:unnamed protein product [Callosobruchus analis]
MISETYNWFSRSSLRRNNYRQLYQTLNDGKDPKKLCSLVAIIECVISSILGQYVELKTHFQIVRTSEKCYNAEILYNMYKDETNLLYLLFLKPVLTNIQQVNKGFESNNADPLKLLADLVLLIREICKMLVIPTCEVDPIREDITTFVDTLNSYLGYNFEATTKNLKESNTITTEQENTIRERCRLFLITLYQQLKQRLPDNIDTLEKISIFSADNMLKHLKPPTAPLLQELNYDAAKITQIEFKYNNLHLLPWQEVKHTVEFWVQVYSYRDATDNNPFKNICDVALTLLVLPFSNAEVQRIFSQLNIVKNKTRNKLSTDMVNSLLCIRYGLKRFL